MSPKGKFVSPYSGKEYRLNQKTSSFLICDILGFKNIVLNHDMQDLIRIMLNLIEDLHSLNIHDFGLSFFKGHKSLDGKLSQIWPKTYKLNASIFSDTIFIYPEDDLEKGELQYEMDVLLLSIASILFFENVLKKYNILLRGSLSYGEYCVIDNPRVIFGKTVIDAYYLESIQNWGGILISPEICDRLRKSHIINTNFTEYLDIPIKEQYQSDFESLCLTHSSFPHVLNWPRIVDDVDWRPIYEKLDEISDPNIRKSAESKINNTKIFYDLIKSRLEKTDIRV